MEAGTPRRVDREPHTRPPTGSVAGSGKRLDGDVLLDARDPAQLLGDDERLHRPARVERGVRVVAAPGTARSRDGAQGFDPVRGRCEDLDGVGAAERTTAILRHQCNHLFAGQAVPDEEHATLVPGDTEPAVAGIAQLDLESTSRPVLTHHEPPITCLPSRIRAELRREHCPPVRA